MIGLPHTAKTVPDFLRHDDNLKQSALYDHSHDYDFVDFRRVGSCHQDRTCQDGRVTSSRGESLRCVEGLRIGRSAAKVLESVGAPQKC